MLLSRVAGALARSGFSRLTTKEPITLRNAPDLLLVEFREIIVCVCACVFVCVWTYCVCVLCAGFSVCFGQKSRWRPDNSLCRPVAHLPRSLSSLCCPGDRVLAPPRPADRALGPLALSFKTSLNSSPLKYLGPTFKQVDNSYFLCYFL